MPERDVPVLHDSGEEDRIGDAVYRIYTVDGAELVAVISARSLSEAEAILAAILDREAA